MNLKKYLKITLILVAAGLIAWLIYFLFRENPVIQNLVNLFPSSEKSGSGLNNGQENIAKPKLQSLTENPIFDYWVSQKTGDIYYLNESGQVLKKTSEKEELANSQTINKLNRIEPSSDGTYALAKFNYPQLPTFSVFNTVTGVWQALPANTLAAAWSPSHSTLRVSDPMGSGQEIIYADDKALKILDILTGKTKEVLKITQKELELSWLSPSTVLLENQSLAGIPSNFWLLNLTTKNLVPFIQGESGLTIQWSKNREFGIKLNNENRAPRTSLIDKNGSTLITFSFVTLPSKCLITEKKIYCAVPKNINEGILLPDDYYKKSVYFDDDFYLIDLGNGSVNELKTDSDLTIDAEHLEISGGKLFFKNRLDDKLYSLTL